MSTSGRTSNTLALGASDARKSRANALKVVFVLAGALLLLSLAWRPLLLNASPSQFATSVAFQPESTGSLLRESGQVRVGTSRVFLVNNSEDPWGNRYYYRGTVGPPQKIYSTGPNGRLLDEDDIQVTNSIAVIVMRRLPRFSFFGSLALTWLGVVVSVWPTRFSSRGETFFAVAFAFPLALLASSMFVAEDALGAALSVSAYEPILSSRHRLLLSVLVPIAMGIWLLRSRVCPR